MTSYTTTTFSSSPASKPSNSDRRVRADFARAAVHMAFGRHAGALDQGDFEDRKAWEVPARAPGAWVR